jgi:hypothetical protein
VTVKAARVSHACAAAIVGCLAIALAPSGCIAGERPAPVSNFGSTPVKPFSDGGGALLAVDGAIPAPKCSLGPDGGVCECIDQPLQITDPPNVYYVLDRSGSMNDPFADGTQTKWQAVVSAIFDVVVQIGPRATVGVTVLPALADGNGCTSGAEVFSPQQGDAPAGVAGPVSVKLLGVLGRIGPEGGTPMATTLQQLPGRIGSLPGKTYVVLATDGGPNCNADAACDTSTCEDNIESLAGCAPTGPNCCQNTAANPNGTSLDCLDAAPTISAVQALEAAGIPVYVVGVPGSEPYRALLDELATSGGTARATEPLYYAVDPTDQSALLDALSAIAAKITASCTLTLNAPPDDPARLNVFLDEKALPQQGADGGSPNWTLDGATVTILGEACQSIQSGAVLDVRVVAGCPTVLR